MIKNISIENFRQFKKLDINDFGVMNIFVGDNNVGKTSVLEALALSHCVKNKSGDIFHSSRFRNFIDPVLGNDLAFRTFFKDLNLENYINIDYTENNYKVSFNIKAITNILNRNEILTKFNEPPISYLELKKMEEYDLLGFYIHSVYGLNSNEEKLYLFTNGGTIKLPLKNLRTAIAHPNESYFFIDSRKNQSFSETWLVLNEFKGDKESKQEFIELLKSFVPTIQDIHDIDKGSTKYIALDLGLKKLIPINVMGDGFNRVLLFLTGIFTKNQRKLYIDDMDSGLHYDAMVDVWKGLLKIEETRKFQLFCTTHSAEMLEAAVEAFADAPEKLRIYRLERHGEETIAKKFTYEEAKGSLEFGLELRGKHRRG